MAFAWVTLSPLERRPRERRATPNVDLSAGMALVIQPNVTLIDHSAGVQTGELVVVTSTGITDMHTLQTGLITV